jgi:hypothetical protein
VSKVGADDFIVATGATAETFASLPHTRLTRSLQDVHHAFGTWLEFPLDGGNQPRYEIIDIALATVVANRMQGDPLWLFLVGPPSAGKTEVISALDRLPDIYPLSSLTAQTFASGFERKGVETSLLPRLGGKTITMKDFGTVLTMYREKKAEILAQLREVYDGKFSKDWGNGKSLSWTGKVGLLAGVTPIIDREYSFNQALGERFLLYRVQGAPARKIAQRALGHQAADSGSARKALRDVVRGFLEEFPLDPPPIPPAFTEALAALAEFVAVARSPVFFDSKGGDIEFIPPPESPGRLAKQFGTLARSLAAVRGEAELSLGTYLTLVQVAQDTLPAPRRGMIEALIDPLCPEPRTTTQIAEATGYPTSTARRYLQELAAHRLVDRLPDGPGHPDRWRASKVLEGLLQDVMDPTLPTGSVREDDVDSTPLTGNVRREGEGSE